MKKLVLISLLLMIFISITTVSATDENATDSQIPEMDNYNSIDLSTGDSDNIIKENENTKDNSIPLSQNQTESKDLNLKISVPQREIAKNERLEINYHVPGHLESSQNLSCYIDDEFNSNLEFNEYSLSGSYYLDMQNYDLGNHTLKICYLGDESYKPFNKTFQIEIANIAFIYNEMMYEHDTKNIYVKLPSDATGTVTIKIGEYSKSFNVNQIEEDYYHGYKQIEYNVNDLKYGNYDLEITYHGNYGSMTKKANITVDYYFAIFNPNYDSTIPLEFASTSGEIFFFLETSAVKGTITSFIDGEDTHYDNDKLTPESYSRSPNYYEGMIFPYAPVYFNNLQLGNHTLTINYSGDDKYPAKSISQNFSVHQYPDFDCDYWRKCYVGSQIPITINLPKGNVGNFSLYISDDGKNYKLIKSENLTDGKAKITYNCTELGEFTLKAMYDTNYDHYEETMSIDVSCIEFPNDNSHYLNRDYAFKTKLPNDATGTFSVYVSENWGEFKLFKTVEIVNGKATIKFKSAKEETYEFRAICNSSYGFENKSEIYTFEDGSKMISATGFVLLYNSDGKYSMKVYGKDGKLVKNTLVNIKIASKNFKVKTNKKGIATIKIKLKGGENLQDYCQI